MFVGDMDTYCKHPGLALSRAVPTQPMVRLRADLNNAVYFFEEMLREKNAPADECGLCTAVAICVITCMVSS